MFQVALGGYRNTPEKETIYDDSPVYYEPGYNFMSPLEMGAPPADQLYILLRKRENSTTDNYSSIIIADLNIRVTDPTTNENIPAHFENNVTTSTIYYDKWNTDPSNFIPVILVINNSINVESPIERVRVLTCTITDNNDVNCFISFRIIVEDENKIFYYIPIEIENLNSRYKFSANGREGIVNVSTNSDVYVLFSPFAYLKEVGSNNSDFSYPLNTIYYYREKTYNNEGFSFSIDRYSHDFIIDNCSLLNIPNYTKAAVLLIDKHMYTEMLLIATPVYVDIKVITVLSEMEDIFRVYLTR